MKFNIPSKTLYSLTSAVSKVINAKNALTILNNFLFTLEDNRLTITGSDVENALMAIVEVGEAEGQGKFCIDARRLVDLLKELPDMGIQFVVDDDTLEVAISYAFGSYTLMATSGDQYPDYKKEEDDEAPVSFVMPSTQLIKGIDSTIFAIGTDDFHPQMMGILLDIKDDSITYVATDTRKLVRFIDTACHPCCEARCILPVKPATILKSVFAKEEDLTVNLTSKYASFSSSQFIFNCRFIKGNFPDYNRVIPRNNEYVLTVDRTSFLNAVRRVGVFVDPGFGLEKFKITADSVHIKSSDANLLTSGTEKLDCEYNGPDMVIGFSAPFLVEICNVLSTQTINVRLSDPSRPGVFQPSENEENTDMLVLLMPMNVQEF